MSWRSENCFSRVEAIIAYHSNQSSWVNDTRGLEKLPHGPDGRTSTFQKAFTEPQKKKTSIKTYGKPLNCSGANTS